jgi:hypothetical protein
VLAVCATVFTAAAAGQKGKWIWLAAVAMVTLSCGRYVAKHTWWDTEDMPTLEAAVASGEGFEGTDEYDPLGDDRTDLPAKREHAWLVSAARRGKEQREARISTEHWTAERRTLRVMSQQEERVAIRLVDYPAWRLTVNGIPVHSEHPAGTAQMIVRVPPGESRIEIRFSRTADRTLGGWVSALAACAALALYVMGGRARAAG